MEHMIAPEPGAPAATDQHERYRFYDLLWGDAVGSVFVAAGATGAEIVARGWPLAATESHGANDVHMLLWTQATGDTFKAAGRPHTGEVFAWPKDRARLDRYVQKLSDAYDAVYCRKFVYESRTDAKYGNPPKHAQIILVEDAPEELPADMPAYSFVIQTSDYSQQGVYRLSAALPWDNARLLAEATRDHTPGADTGGPSPSQFTRIPTTVNTKDQAVRFRVRLIEGHGDIALATLAGAVFPDGMGGLSAAHRQRQHKHCNGKAGPGLDDPQWVAAVDAAVGWRGYLWKDDQPWKDGPQLRVDGTPRALKAEHEICRVLRGEMSWAEMAVTWGGKDATPSGLLYHLVGALYLVGCELPQIIALAEVLMPDARAKGDGWFYHQTLWGCLYRTGNRHEGWAILLPDIPRRPWKRFSARRIATIPEPERVRRGRKPGAHASMVDIIATLLVPGQEVTRKHLRDQLAYTTGRSPSPRQMTRYMGELTTRGLVTRNAAQGEHYRVVRGVARNSHAANAPAREGGVAINCSCEGGSHSPRFEASQCGVPAQVDHTPPCAGVAACAVPVGEGVGVGEGVPSGRGDLPPVSVATMSEPVAPEQVPHGSHGFVPALVVSAEQPVPFDVRAWLHRAKNAPLPPLSNRVPEPVELPAVGEAHAPSQHSFQGFLLAPEPEPALRHSPTRCVPPEPTSCVEACSDEHAREPWGAHQRQVVDAARMVVTIDLDDLGGYATA